MERICIQVVPSRRIGAGAGFVVYGGGADGAVDWSRPITTRRQLFRRHAVEGGGHLSGGHMATWHVDVGSLEGHLEGTHLLDEQGYPAGAAVFETRPHVFGRFGFALVSVDAAGNVAGAEGMSQKVVNSWPAAGRELEVVSHEAESGRLRFRFVPSWMLRG